ncbi:MAG: 4Fe-4S binding protein [Methanosarcinales archaeon Met12]|nr:MAG: 4Fe-4S binding protein [Methanosarcinales archaeon Met12]
MVIKIDLDACIGCGACVDECPVDAISLNDDVASVDEGLCTDCGMCIDVCPINAISF